MKLKYCPFCSQTMSAKSSTEYVCVKRHQFWNNPHGAVAIIIAQDNQLLYAERRHQPHKGKFDFPGGFLEFNENWIEAAKREIKEETNLTVSDLEVVEVNIHNYDTFTSVCDIIVIAKNWQGELMPQDDVASLVWKPIEFIDSPDFAWPYPGLSAKLTKKL